jgi:hypothetical protein
MQNVSVGGSALFFSRLEEGYESWPERKNAFDCLISLLTVWTVARVQVLQRQ